MESPNGWKNAGVALALSRSVKAVLNGCWPIFILTTLWPRVRPKHTYPPALPQQREIPAVSLPPPPPPASACFTDTASHTAPQVPLRPSMWDTKLESNSLTYSLNTTTHTHRSPAIRDFGKTTAWLLMLRAETPDKIMCQWREQDKGRLQEMTPCQMSGVGGGVAGLCWFWNKCPLFKKCSLL